MKLYFENSKGERRVIAEPTTEEEAMREIYKFCEDRNFKIYYTRSWTTQEGLTQIDAGSWSEFFFIEQ